VTTGKYVEVQVGQHRFRGLLLDDAAPAAAGSLWNQLPVSGTMALDLWSGYVTRAHISARLGADDTDTVVALPHPGLIAWDPRSGDLAVCFGQGRLRDGLGPIPTYPLVQLGGDLSDLVQVGSNVQYGGSVPLEMRRSADQAAPLQAHPRESSADIVLALGESQAVGSLLTSSAPVAAASFRQALPLIGSATSTFLSGPLIRYRANDRQNGATLALHVGDEDVRHQVMWPGYIYYRPEEPSGLRITTTETAIMADLGGRVTSVIPVARLDDVPEQFKTAARGVVAGGRTTLSISLGSQQV
jgi:hypothetical protein